MMKKIFIVVFLCISFFPLKIYASDLPNASINGVYYDLLEDAILAANSDDTIVVNTNVELNHSLIINKTVNIDLNNKIISAPSNVFKVQGGSLNLTGKGTIKEYEPNYGAIMVVGSNNLEDKDYSVIKIGRDVTLEGWSGIFINQNLSKSYGVLVNFSGSINAVNDMSGSKGAGIYVNGNIKNKENAPVVNVINDAKISSTGVGLYIAGYSTFNLENSTISGVTSGVGIKSGVLNINGAKVYSVGSDNTPTEGDNNGINSSGAAIQIESNSGYVGDIELNIHSGIFESKSSYAMYEYIGSGSKTTVKNINIKDGIFVSGNSKNVFKVSDSFGQKHKNFISGGEYSSDVSAYLKPGYSLNHSNNFYSVLKSSMKEVWLSNNQNKSDNSLLIKIGFLSIIGIALIVFTYIFREKIKNIL